jgi:hypothetical protein
VKERESGLGVRARRLGILFDGRLKARAPDPLAARAGGGILPVQRLLLPNIIRLEAPGRAAEESAFVLVRAAGVWRWVADRVWQRDAGGGRARASDGGQIDDAGGELRATSGPAALAALCFHQHELDVRGSEGALSRTAAAIFRRRAITAPCDCCWPVRGPPAVSFRRAPEPLAVGRKFALAAINATPNPGPVTCLPKPPIHHARLARLQLPQPPAQPSPAKPSASPAAPASASASTP